jgi:hypothetical protein
VDGKDAEAVNIDNKSSLEPSSELGSDKGTLVSALAGGLLFKRVVDFFFDCMSFEP